MTAAEVPQDSLPWRHSQIPEWWSGRQNRREGRFDPQLPETIVCDPGGVDCLFHGVYHEYYAKVKILLLTPFWIHTQYVPSTVIAMDCIQQFGQYVSQIL